MFDFFMYTIIIAGGLMALSFIIGLILQVSYTLWQFIFLFGGMGYVWYRETFFKNSAQPWD